jgi:5'-nucleotidase
VSGGAVMAFTNPGGVRTDIARKEDGKVTYADIFASQPFRNQLVTLTLTGKQIKDMLEQQWSDPKRPRILQVSKGFAYAWDGSRPDGERILAERMSLDGTPIDPAVSYRVTVNNYLSVGGDGFTVFKDGKAPQFGVYDVDALDTYFRSNSPVAPGAANRIVRIN